MKLRALTKGIFPLILFLLPFALFAESFEGEWICEVIFVENPLIIKFIDKNVYSIQEVNINEINYYNYSLSSDSKIIHFGNIDGMDVEAFYEFVDQDTFLLYPTDTMISFFMEELIEGMDLKEEDIPNKITEEFINRLIISIENSFKDAPIIRCKRIH